MSRWESPSHCDRDNSLVYIKPFNKIFYNILLQTKSVVDVNSPCRESGNTPLHAAANWGYAEMVTLLLEKGEADVNATNPQCDHATPLHLSVMQGKMIQALSFEIY